MDLLKEWAEINKAIQASPLSGGRRVKVNIEQREYHSPKKDTMVDCDYFEIIDWDEETQEIYHAVCTLPSPIWPNCNRCQHKVEYRDVAAEVLDGSINRQVRVNNDEDNEVHRLYHIYKSL